MTYQSFNTSSAEDSLMPRRREHTGTKALMDWEFLDDVSLGMTVETDNDLDSMSSFADESPGSISDSTTVSSNVTAVLSDSSTTPSMGSASSAHTIKTMGSTTQSVPTTAMVNAVEEAAIGKKAVKADEAQVPVHLWNDRIQSQVEKSRKNSALTGLRDFGLQLFRRALYLDCVEHLKEEFGHDWAAKREAGSLPIRSASGRLTHLGRELEAIRNILWHANETNWFEYLAGSRLHQFRFPLRYRKEAHDGTPIRFEKAGPTSRNRQPDIAPELIDQVRSKINKVIKRRYMTRVATELDIKSLIKYFAVPKGESDIRMVYDATASGLNEAVWAPTFWLPTIDSLVRSLDANSWMTDRDIGDMFLNFPLHESARPYAGVDIKPILVAGETKQHRWYQWTRNAMGFAPSPYNSIKMSLIAEEVIKGDRHNPQNPFHWERVQLNLPGATDYDPTKSWIMKVRRDGRSASEVFTFVDDERAAGATQNLTWEAGHTVAAKQAYLGIQDAARKADECTQQPRAWAGAVVHIDAEKGVCILTSEEKWRKLKKILIDWLTVLEEGANSLDHTKLLSDRGFLVYVTRAYPSMIPYMKGFHLTVEMWRGNRDAEGWKLPPEKVRFKLPPSDSGQALEIDEDEAVARHAIRRRSASLCSYAPQDGTTRPAPRLKDDLKALLHLASSDLPPLRMVRPKHTVQVFFWIWGCFRHGERLHLSRF
ncbi:MAG: hypothetical protein ACO3R2_16720, partial [bacterium]